MNEEGREKLSRTLLVVVLGAIVVVLMICGAMILAWAEKNRKSSNAIQLQPEKRTDLKFLHVFIDPNGDQYGKILIIKYNGNAGTALYFAEPNDRETLLGTDLGPQRTGRNCIFMYFEKTNFKSPIMRYEDRKQIMRLPANVYDNLIESQGTLILRDDSGSSAIYDLTALKAK
jgi:hypothetical protein